METATFSEIISLLNNANTLRNKGDFDDAYDIYSQVVKKDDNNPEGYWGLFLCEYGIMHVEDTKTKKYVPTCNRASVVSVFEDENYKKAIELAGEFQKDDLKQNAENLEIIRAKVIELSKKEKSYDIFICYKRTQDVVGGEGSYTKDSIQAREIYEMLTKEGYKVFFAEKTIVAGTLYEPVIFNALSTSKVMVVISSKLEYLNSAWVKNEWRRFLKQMEFDESKKIMPIMFGGMTPNKLPDLLKKYQGLEVGVNFETSFLNTINRYIGLSKKNNVERVSIDDKKATRKSNVVKSSIETRTLSDKKDNVFVVSDQVQLRNAFIYIKQKLYKDVIEEFEGFLDNPKLKPIAEYALAFIELKLKSRGIKDLKKFSQKDILSKVDKTKEKDPFIDLDEEFAKYFIEKFNACIECAYKEITDIVFKDVVEEYQNNFFNNQMKVT